MPHVMLSMRECDYSYRQWSEERNSLVSVRYYPLSFPLPSLGNSACLHAVIFVYAHYTDIPWESHRLKSPPTRLLVPQHVKVNNKGNTEAPHYCWSFVSGIHRSKWSVDSAQKGRVISKAVSCHVILWCHHAHLNLFWMAMMTRLTATTKTTTTMMMMMINLFGFRIYFCKFQ